MVNGRKVKSPWWLLLCGLSVLILLGGCAPSGTVVDETDERAYRRGKSLLREGRKDEALQAFLAVISARADAGESHLESGLIYLNHIKDPLAAIYHFRGYLALNPEGEHAGFVNELILTAQKDFAKTLPGNPFEATIDRVNLMETVKDLQAENTRLKENVLQLQGELDKQSGELRRYRQSVAEQTARPSAPAQVAPIVIQSGGSPAAAGEASPGTYTVQAGDTLSRISAQVYGTSGKWMDIFQANRDQLPSPNSLKPGQVLRIP